MKSSSSDIALLEAYINGSLDQDEKRNLENRLVSDEQLSSDLEDLQMLKQGIRIHALSDKLKFLKDIESKGTPIQVKVKESGKSFSNLWKWLLLIFMLSVLGYFLYQSAFKDKSKMPVQYQQLFSEKFDSELILHKTVRAVVQNDSLSQYQRRAYELYSLQLFDESGPLLQKLWEEDRDTLALFYLGVSELGLGDIAKGLEILKRPELKKYQKQINLFINH